MDKFMIDPKPEPINELPPSEENISISAPNTEPPLHITSIDEPSVIPSSDEKNEFVSMPSWSSWIFWVLTLLAFLIFYFYYSAKYAANESHYVIKSNATSFKVSLDELKEDIKAWFLGWKKWLQTYNDNLYDKSSQFFFRQHIENGAFVSKQYHKEKMGEDTEENKI